MADPLGQVQIDIVGNIAPFEQAIARARALASNLGGVGGSSSAGGITKLLPKPAELKELENSGKKLQAIFKDAAGVIASFQGPLGPIAGRINFLGSTFGRVGLAVGTFSIAIAGAAFATQKAVRAFAEEEEQLNTLNAILKSTGYSAGQTSRSLADLADAVSKTTLATDDQVRSAEALLLTFRSVSGVEFPRTIKAAQDLAAAGFGSVTGAAMQLGKALEDPVAGLQALRRSGVTFTALQKEMIRNFIETGQVARAHAEILRTVEQQVGGSGAAAASGLTGAFHRFTETVNDSQVALGKWFSQLVNLPGVLDNLTNVMKNLAESGHLFSVEADKAVVTDLFERGLISAERYAERLAQLKQRVTDLNKAAEDGGRDWDRLAAAMGQANARAEAATDKINQVMIALKRETSEAGLNTIEQEVQNKAREAGVLGNKKLEASIRALIIAKHQEADIQPSLQRSRERANDIALAAKELELVGKSTEEQERLRSAYEETSRYRLQQANQSIAVDQKEIASIEAKAAAIARYGQQLREANKNLEVEFSRQTQFLSDTEKSVASALQDAFGPTWKDHMDDVIAQQTRLQGVLQQSYDITRDFAGTLVDDILAGKSAVDALTDAFKNLEKKILDMALDAVIKGMFSALSGGGAAGGGIFGSLLGGISGGGAKSGGVFGTGGVVGSTPVPPLHKHGAKLAYDEYPAILHVGETVIPVSGKKPNVSGAQMTEMFGGVPKLEGGFNAASAAAGGYTAGDTGATGSWSTVSGGGGNATLSTWQASQYTGSNVYTRSSVPTTGGSISLPRTAAPTRLSSPVIAVPGHYVNPSRFSALGAAGGAASVIKHWVPPTYEPRYPIHPEFIIGGGRGTLVKTTPINQITLPTPRPSWAPQGVPVTGHYARPPTGPELTKLAVEYPAGQQQYGPIFQPTRAERAFTGVGAGASITDRAVGFGAFPWLQDTSTQPWGRYSPATMFAGGGGQQRTPVTLPSYSATFLGRTTTPNYGAGTFVGGHGVYGTGSMAGAYGLSVSASEQGNVFQNYGAGTFAGGYGGTTTYGHPWSSAQGSAYGAQQWSSLQRSLSRYGPGATVGWPGAGSTVFRTAARSQDDGVRRNVIADLTRRGLTGTSAAPLISDLLGRTGYPGPYVTAGRTATDARRVGTEINFGPAPYGGAFPWRAPASVGWPGAGSGLPAYTGGHQWSGAQGYAVPRTSYTPFAARPPMPWNPANDPASGYGLGAGVPQWDYPEPVRSGGWWEGPSTYTPQWKYGAPFTPAAPGAIFDPMNLPVRTPAHFTTDLGPWTTGTPGRTGYKPELQGIGGYVRAFGGGISRLGSGVLGGLYSISDYLNGRGTPRVTGRASAAGDFGMYVSVPGRVRVGYPGYPEGSTTGARLLSDVGAPAHIDTRRFDTGADNFEGGPFDPFYRVNLGGFDVPGDGGKVPVQVPGPVLPGAALPTGMLSLEPYKFRPGVDSMAGMIPSPQNLKGLDLSRVRGGDTANLRLVSAVLQDSEVRGFQHMDQSKYRLWVTEGYTPTGHKPLSGHKWAGHGAVDVFLQDKTTGMLLNRYGATKGGTHPAYDELANFTRMEMTKNFPSQVKNLRYGGAWAKGGVAAHAGDAMHQDMGHLPGGRSSSSRRSSSGRSGRGRRADLGGDSFSGYGLMSTGNRPGQGTVLQQSPYDTMRAHTEDAGRGGSLLGQLGSLAFSSAKAYGSLFRGLTKPVAIGVEDASEAIFGPAHAINIASALGYRSEAETMAAASKISQSFAGSLPIDRGSFSPAGRQNLRFVAPSTNVEDRRYRYTDQGELVPLYSTGGVVGSTPVPHRMVNPKIFKNAPRFQRGTGDVGPGEYPAILHSGETVTPAGGRSASSSPIIVNTPAAPPSVVTINVMNNANATVATNTQEDSNGGTRIDIMIDEMVSAKMRDGGSRIARTMGSMGARPQPVRR
jgi:hypothetical protein